MKKVKQMLATTPVIAQIVPENKGYVLSAQDSNDKTVVLLITVSAIVTVLMLVCLIIYRRKHKRHYRSR